MFTKTFRGGTHLSEHKELTVDKKIRPLNAPAEVILPLGQHIGAPNKAIVNVGDSLKAGQRIGETDAFVSSPVHSSVSGKVKAISSFFNPVLGKSPAITIENDGKNETIAFVKREEPETLPKEELIKIIKDAGIVGMGGATFPTHVKLNVPKGKSIDTLIVNGAECEPYLTCDHRLMLEKTNEILKGIKIVARILGVKNIILGVEENKLSAIFALEKHARQINKNSPQTPIQIIMLKTKYPQGGERQLLKAILKREVPPGKLPLDVGALVQNVGTCFAIYEAVYEGKPLTERCVTFTGSPLAEPGNFVVKLGMRLRDAIESSGGFKEDPAKIIVGGPMMGAAQYSLDIPIIKGVTGVVFLSKKESEVLEETPCIRCAKCVDICPVNLTPTEIMRMVKYLKWYNMPKLHATDCMECGACAYTCPSSIPLVQYIKLAKLEELKKKQ